jgi:hypothetical protein
MSNKEWNKAPEKNTSQWKKNESTIARNPFYEQKETKHKVLSLVAVFV